MTAEDVDLGDDWSKELEAEIDRIISDFDTTYQLNILRRLLQQANRYAKTLAGVVGYTPIIGNIFQGVNGFADASETKYLEEPTPYSVCGLGDIDRLVGLDQFLRNKFDQSADLDFEYVGTCEKISYNKGSQFAPMEITNRHTYKPRSRKATLRPSEDLNKDRTLHFAAQASSAVKGSVAETERNKWIARVNSSSISDNLKKCNVLDEDNPFALVALVLSAIGNDPHSLVNQLKA
jgi:hypothetical protein